MSGKRRMNVVSVWVIVIFTVVAITLVLMLGMLYRYLSREELRHTMREQVAALADNADAQLVDCIETQALQRLAGKPSASTLIQSLSVTDSPSSSDIRSLSNVISQTTASLQAVDRMELFFPRSQIVVGSAGVRFLAAKKYAVSASSYEALTALYPEDFKWLRRVLPGESATDAPYLTFLRLYPGVFPDGTQPLLVLSVSENAFHKQLRQMLRALDEQDQVLLITREGVIWSAEDNSLVGCMLPTESLSADAVTLPNGTRAWLAERASSSAPWQYVIARSHGIPFSSGVFSLWGVGTVVLIIALLMTGLALVLRILMKHYALPMQRLMRQLSIPDVPADGGRLVSPSENFQQIESAFADINEAWQEQDAFLAEASPVLRNAWLNFFIRGEAHYDVPLEQLDIRFPHPYFQAVVASQTPTEAEKACVFRAFPKEDWEIACFETLEKETVWLFNHGFDEEALPNRLQCAAAELDALGSALVLGVGVLALREDLVAASFRCARRALTEQYFESGQRVCVFRPRESHLDSGEAMTQVVSQLSALVANVRNQKPEQTEKDVDNIVAGLKTGAPYLNAMRSIMLLSAMFLSKAVYDAKRVPEEIYGEPLMDVYYHLGSISEYQARFKADVRRLAAFWAQESSPSNRSVVQYAIHYIRSTPPAELSIQTIADSMAISTGHLSRLFHQETGKKLVDFLQEVRMDAACRLLREGRLSNEEICQQVGYSRVQYFAAKFKERWGMTLNEYRRQAQAEINRETDKGSE